MKLELKFGINLVRFHRIQQIEMFKKTRKEIERGKKNKTELLVEKGQCGSLFAWL